MHKYIDELEDVSIGSYFSVNIGYCQLRGTPKTGVNVHFPVTMRSTGSPVRHLKFWIAPRFLQWKIDHLVSCGKWWLFSVYFSTFVIFSHEVEKYIPNVKALFSSWRKDKASLKMKNCEPLDEKMFYVWRLQHPGKLEYAAHITEESLQLQRPDIGTEPSSFQCPYYVVRSFGSVLPVMVSSLRNGSNRQTELLHR